MRSDTVLGNGTRIESRPRTLARHFFDKYGLAYGVLNAGSQHIGLSPEPDYAAAVLAAENDVLAADWLPADPRFRASLTVCPADPELIFHSSLESKYDLALRKIGIDPAMLSTQAGHA